MPILCREPDLYPEDLLDAAQPDTGRCWWVLYTKSRQEKAVARQLLSHDIPYYVPMARNVLVYRERRIASYVPLFTGYVFMYGTVEERAISLATGRVPRVLAIADTERFTHELGQIHQLVQSGVRLTPESQLAPGKRVRIRSGALAGLEGTVIQRRGETRLVVSVDFIQQGASVQIDDFLLEPI